MIDTAVIAQQYSLNKAHDIYCITLTLTLTPNPNLNSYSNLQLLTLNPTLQY